MFKTKYLHICQKTAVQICWTNEVILKQNQNIILLLSEGINVAYFTDNINLLWAGCNAANINAHG